MAKPNPNAGVADPLGLSKGLREAYSNHQKQASSLVKSRQYERAKDQFFAAGRAAETLALQEDTETENLYWFEMAAKNYENADEFGKAVGAYQHARKILSEKDGKITARREMENIEKNIGALEQKIAERRKPMSNVAAVVAAASFLISAVFGLTGMTGRAVFSFGPIESKGIGAIFFILSLIACFVSLKTRK